MTLRLLPDLTLTQNFVLTKDGFLAAKMESASTFVRMVVREFVRNFTDHFEKSENEKRVVIQLLNSLYSAAALSKNGMVPIQMKTVFYVDDGKEHENTMQLRDREARALFYEIQRTIENDETMTREDFVSLRKVSMKFLVHFQKEYE